MQFVYIQQEIIVRRTARKENAAVWKKETAALKWMQTYCQALQKKQKEFDCVTMETEGGPYTNLAQCQKAVWKATYMQEVGISIDWLKDEEDISAHCASEADTAAGVLQHLARKDDTHCFALREIIHFGDPDDQPQIFSKTFEEQTLHADDEEVWQRAIPVTETAEAWEGDLTCALRLPNANAIPQYIVDAYHEITDRYCAPGTASGLFETLVDDDLKGGMDGGCFETFVVPGDQLGDFLTRMQHMSDLFRALGGIWTVNNWMYSKECTLLCVATDEKGVVEAKYIKL